MINGYMAAVITLLCWTVSNFVLARLTRLVDPGVLNKAALFCSIFLLGLMVCVVDGLLPWQLFTIPTPSNWLWLGLSGILGKSIGDYCGFCAMRILGVRRRSMVSTTGPGFTWLWGLIILDETLNGTGLAAMGITMLFLFLLINSTAEKKEVLNDRFGMPLPGLGFGLAAAALTGLAFILSKLTFLEPQTRISAFHGTWIRVIAAFVAIGMVDVLRRKPVVVLKPFITHAEKGVLLLLTILFGSMLGLSFSLVAITTLHATVAYSIFSMLPVTVMLVNIVFLKQKISGKSLLYSVSAIAGVLILIWRRELADWHGH